MELNALVSRQIAADRRRGFPVDFTSTADRLVQLERDLIGLTGEVGEFANALKKVRLALENERYEAATLDEAGAHLREELVDALIYIMRLSFILGGDLEQDLGDKMGKNDLRYGSIEAK